MVTGTVEDADDPLIGATVEFTYTEANKAIVDERGGMLIVGYGYRLSKVTVK